MIRALKKFIDAIKTIAYILIAIVSAVAFAGFILALLAVVFTFSYILIPIIFILLLAIGIFVELTEG